MGGGKKSKAPATPDYAALQTSDALANYRMAQDLTAWNRPTQVDAFGNTMSWSQDGNGNWTQRVTQHPAMQRTQEELLQSIFNSAQGLHYQGDYNPTSIALARNAYDQYGQNPDFTGPQTGMGYFQFENAGPIGNFDRTQGDQVAKDMYESAMSRLRPEQSRSKEALDNKLRLQGLQPGTEAYNRAMQNEMTSQGDVTAKLGLDSTAAGYQAAQNIYNTNLAGQGQRFNQQLADYQVNQAKEQQQFDQALQRYQANLGRDATQAQLAAGLQQQEYNQNLQNYSLPMERAQALSQLYSQVPRPEFQGFNSATGYSPANMTGAAQATYQAKMGQANAGANKKGGLLSAGSSLGSSYLLGK